MGRRFRRRCSSKEIIIAAVAVCRHRWKNTRLMLAYCCHQRSTTRPPWTTKGGGPPSKKSCQEHAQQRDLEQHSLFQQPTPPLYMQMLWLVCWEVESISDRGCVAWAAWMASFSSSKDFLDLHWIFSLGFGFRFSSSMTAQFFRVCPPISQ